MAGGMAAGGERRGHDAGRGREGGAVRGKLLGPRDEFGKMRGPRRVNEVASQPIEDDNHDPTHIHLVSRAFRQHGGPHRGSHSPRWRSAELYMTSRNRST